METLKYFKNFTSVVFRQTILQFFSNQKVIYQYDDINRVNLVEPGKKTENFLGTRTFA